MIIAYIVSLLAGFAIPAIEFVQSTLTAWFHGGDRFSVFVLALSIFSFYAFAFIIGLLALRYRLKTGTASHEYNAALAVAGFLVFLQGASSILRPFHVMTLGHALEIGIYAALGLLIGMPYVVGVLARKQTR